MNVRPFSPWRYILNNKLRAMVLILMMSFITVVFVCGMYIDNTPEIFRVSVDPSDRYIFIYQRTSSKEARAQFDQMKSELPDLLPENANTILSVYNEYQHFESIMKFNCGHPCYIFTSQEDFDLFRSRTHLIPEDVKLQNLEIVMSEYLANNIDLKLGDAIPDSEFRVGKIESSWEGVRAYGIDENSSPIPLMVLSNDGVCDQKLHDELNAISRELSKKYPLIAFETNSVYQETCEQDFEFMYLIFGAMTVLLSAVLLITINATFAAAYDKRKHEFAIYKAMGFTKGQIFRKVAGEVLVMNAMGLLIGAIMNAGVILVCNQVLWSQGQYFYRVSKFAVIVTCIIEAFFIISMTLLNWRKVRKCEVTEE